MAVVVDDLVQELLSEMPLPVGAAVVLHGLQTNVLNGCTGVVVRRLDPPSDRVEVLLDKGGRDGGRTVRVRLQHVQPVVPAPPPPLHLGLARAAAVKRTGFFYAFGNTPPLYVLPGVPLDADARVLLLGSGDLRAPLYSIYRDAAGATRAAPRRLEFLVNDTNPHVAARNVVLLHLALDGRVSADALFSVWFSLCMSPPAAEALRAALRELTGPAANAALCRLGVSFHAAGEREAVAAVWRAWASWTPSCAQLRAARRRVLEDRFPGSLQAAAGCHAMPLLMRISQGNEDFPMRAATEEVVKYFETGSVPVLVTAATGNARARRKAKARAPREAANPTLLQSPTTWDLHYGAEPFAAFPLFETSYAAQRPLASSCVKQLASWAAALRATDGGVRWTFSLADCLSLCGCLPRASPYDVVASSNLMDHVGLLPLLQAMRGIVSPGGCLLTQSLLGSSYSESSEELLRVHLGTDPAHWPGVLGWRCLGYEGALAPEHSAFQLDLPDVMALCRPAQRGMGAVVRSEANFVWSPAELSSLPTRAGPGHADVVASCRVSVGPSLFGPLVAFDCRFRTHLLTLLPTFLACPDMQRLLCAESDWEVSDILQGVLHGARLCVATVRVPAALLDFGRAAQIPLAVVLVKGRRLVVYTGLSVTGEAEDRSSNGEGRCWVARWLLHPSRLTPDTDIFLVRNLAPQTLPVVKTFSVEDVALSPVPASRLAVWADRFAPPPLAPDQESLFSRGGGVKDLPARWEVCLSCLPAAWRSAVDAGKPLTASCIPERDNAVRIGVGASLCSPVVLSLPGPVAPVSPLLGRRNSRLSVVLAPSQYVAVVCIPKGLYAFGTLAPADLVHHDTRVWKPSRVAPSAMVLYIGLQMTSRERVLRNLPLQLVPPLTAAKDTIACILHHPDAPAVLLAIDGAATPLGAPADVHAVLLPRGTRVEHRTGVPAMELAACFLHEEDLPALAPFLRCLHTHGAEVLIRTSPAEFALLEAALRLMAGRAKQLRRGTADSGWATGGRVAVPPPLRRYFMPLLLQPLFVPVTRETLRELH